MYGLLVSSFMAMVPHSGAFFDLEKDSYEVKKCDHSNYEDYIWALPRIEKLILKTTKGCQLQGIDLSEKRLRGANFCMADLTGANLKGANLTGASFIRSDISGADFTEVIDKDAYVEKIQFDKDTQWEFLSDKTLEQHEVPFDFTLEDYQNGIAEEQEKIKLFFSNVCEKGYKYIPYDLFHYVPPKVKL